MLKIVFYTEFSLEFGGGGTFISLWVFIPQILAGYKKTLQSALLITFSCLCVSVAMYGLKPARGPGVGGGPPNAPPPPPAPNRSGPPQPPQQPPSARGKTQQPVTGTTRAGLMCWVK